MQRKRRNLDPLTAAGYIFGGIVLAGLGYVFTVLVFTL
jgi:hypothetical protein